LKCAIGQAYRKAGPHTASQYVGLRGAHLGLKEEGWIKRLWCILKKTMFLVKEMRGSQFKKLCAF